MSIEEKKTEICSKCLSQYINISLKTLEGKLLCNTCFRWITAKNYELKALADFYNNHVYRSKVFTEKWFTFKATFKRKFILKEELDFIDDVNPVFICGLCNKDLAIYWEEYIGVLRHLQEKHQDFLNEFKEEVK